MPELMTEEEIRVFLNSPDENAAVNFSGLNPDFSKRASAMSTPLLGPEAANRLFVERNKQGNVPLDIESGAPLMQRMAASFQTEPDAILKYWQNQYGADNVRSAKDGSLIVRMPDEASGGMKDVLVDERNLSTKDMSDLAGMFPEIVGAVLAIRGGRSIPGIGKAEGFWGRMRDIASAAFGQEGGGAIKDLVARPLVGVPVQPGEVLKRRAMNLPIDAAFDAAGAAVAKAASKAITPFGSEVPEVIKQGKEAQAFWKAQPDQIDIPLSAGQESGNVFILRSESQVPKMPGAARPFADLRDQQIEGINKAANVTVGLPANATPADLAAVPGMEELTDRLKNAVQTKLEPLQERITTARRDLVQNANLDILRAIEQGTGRRHREVYDTVAGDSIRSRYIADLEDFHRVRKQKYGAMENLPGGKDRILQPGNFSKEAQSYLDQEIPVAVVQKQVATPLVGPNGQPLTKTVTVRQIMDKFIPEDVIGRLTQLAEYGKGPWSLSDLITMRNDVDNAIAAGQAIPGVKTHHLDRIRDMFTRAMNEAVDKLPQPGLKDAWKEAESWYKANRKRFDTASATSILRKPGEPGFIGNDQLFERLSKGIDRVDEVRRFLGPNSTEIQILRRRIADKLYENSLASGQPTKLNAKDFLESLSNMQRNQRELFEDVFGTQGNRLIQQAQLATVGQSDKLDRALLEQGISNPRAFPDLWQLIKAERNLDRQFNNKIVRMIGSKSVPAEGLEPNELVSWMFRSAKPRQAKEVMDIIADNPGLQWQVRARAMVDLFEEASRKPTPQDKMQMRLYQKRIPSAAKLTEILNDPKRGDVYRSVFTPDQVEKLDNLIKVMRPMEMQEAAFSQAGGIGAGMVINNIWGGQLGNYIDKAMHYYIGATLLTTPVLRHYVSNNLMTPANTAKLIDAAIYSTPMAQMVIKDFGEETGKRMLETTSANVNAWAKEQGATPERGHPSLSTDEEIRAFLNSK